LSTPALFSMPSRAAMGLLNVCAAGFLWGTGGLVVHMIQGRDALSVLTISTYRLSLAAAALFAVLMFLGRVSAVREAVRERPDALLLLGLTTAAYQTLYFGSVVTVGVSVATVVTLGLAPVLLTGVDAVRARQRPNGGRLAVVGAAVCGLALVSLSAGHGATSRPALGLALAVASGCAFAVATDQGARLTDHADPLTLASATTVVGAAALCVLGLVIGSRGTPAVPADASTAVLLVYLGVITMALAYACLYAGLRTMPSSSAVVATLVEPVTAAVLAAAFLGERLGGKGVLGTILILGAIAGLRHDPTDGAHGREEP
jgi:DME family drug/metabolite transporter